MKMSVQHFAQVEAPMVIDGHGLFLDREGRFKLCLGSKDTWPPPSLSVNLISHGYQLSETSHISSETISDLNLLSSPQWLWFNLHSQDQNYV